MSRTQKSLDDLFQQARAENAPEDVFSVARTHTPSATPRRSPVMSPMFIALTVGALAAAGAITVSVIHDDSGTKTKLVKTTEYSAPQTMSINTPPTPPTDEPKSTTKSFTFTSFVHTDDDLGEGGSGSIQVCALSCDDDVTESLSIEPGALNIIRSRLFDADSLTACLQNKSEQTVKVCVFRNGSQQEIAFLDKPGPLPVMFTSMKGRGHVVGSFFPTDLDANNLIPVATPESDDVIMWYPPTNEFLNSLPDSLARDLEESIVVDVRADSNKRVIRIQRNMNSVHDGNIKQLWIDSTMNMGNQDLSNLNLDKLMSSMKFNMDTLMNCVKEISVDINAINIKSSQTPSLNSQIVVITRKGTKKSTAASPDAMLQETRTSAGAITNTSIFPNPTSDGGATLRLTLKEDRVLTVTLHDLAGNVISTLGQGIRKTAGDSQIAITLSDVPAGMYLVTITTNQNEKVVQRLIVQ